MKKIYLLFILLSAMIAMHAQSVAPKDSSAKQVIPDDSVFTAPAILADFPGGSNGWMSYLIHNLTYPADAQSYRIQGRVEVEFIVEKNGRLRNIHAISGPKQLQEEGVRLIKGSPKWIPAIQDGQKVRSLRTQGIEFRLS